MKLEPLYAILAEVTVPISTVGGLCPPRALAGSATWEAADRDGAVLVMVDVHYFVVAVRKAQAEAHREALVRALAAYPEPERLALGPSYIELGAVLGDQEAALRLIGLGAALKLWQVVTPALLKLGPKAADDLAGRGFVMMTGYPPHPPPVD